MSQHSNTSSSTSSTSSISSRVTVVVAVVAVLVVVLVTVVGASLFQLIGGRGDNEPSTGGAPSAAPGSSPHPAAGECARAPAPPSSPPSFDTVPPESLAQGTRWKATVATNCGNVVFELSGDKAPQTVASFIFLAEKGYWKDSPCHRLVTQGIFVLQCGDPSGTGSGDPGYGFGIENAPPDGSYPRGTLAMARTADPNTNGGQFFVVFDDTELPVEGGGYSIFGRVVEGMDIVDRVAEAGVGGSLGQEAPAQPISILDVTVKKMA